MEKNTKEINARIAAAWIKWNAFKSVLCLKCLPMRTRKLFFLALVLNTLISTLEAFVLTTSEIDSLNVFLCKRVRALLLGRAHSFEFDRHVQLSNVKVLKQGWGK